MARRTGRTVAGMSSRSPRPARRRLVDLLRTTDPGWSRARTAVAALLAGALGGGVPALVLAGAGSSTLPAALGAAVGLLGAIVAPGAPSGAWWPTVAAASAAAGLLGLGTGRPLWLDGLTTLVVVAGAAGLARLGQAARSAGLLAFLVHVLVLRIGLGPQDAAGLVGATTAGTLALLAAHVAVLAPRPRHAAAVLRRALTSRLSLTVDAAVVLVARGPGRGRQLRLRRRLVAVQETALELDRVLATGGDDAQELRRRVLAVEALADHLVWTVLTLPPDTPATDRARLARELDEVRHDEADRDVTPLVPHLAGRDDRTLPVVRRLATAAVRLQATAAPPLPDRLPTDPPGPPTPVGRVLLQSLLAVAVAFVVGVLVAPDEWYWSVIGAFVVVTTTGDRGAGLRKATDRVVGTAAGVAAGLVLAGLLQPGGVALVVVLVVLLGAVAWVFRRSYRWTMLALTAAVALLYQLLGRLTVEVLLLRLAETVAGALVAAVVVAVVRPVPARATVDAAVGDLLAALSAALDDLRGGALPPARVREVDAAVSALRVATEPLAAGLPGGALSGRVRGARLLATAVRVRVAALATAASHAGLGTRDREVLAAVAQRLARLRAHLDDPALLEDDGPRPTPTGGGEVAEVLRTLDDRLAGYATLRGLRLRDDPGALSGGVPSPRA